MFLELLREAGIPAMGIDIDTKCVAAAHAKGLQVEHALAERYLVEKQNTFDGVFLGHIIEHMTGIEATCLLYHCYRALRPGGVLILLTPNFQHFEVASWIFWLDITHQRPYPLQLLEHIFKVLGLKVLEAGLENEMNLYIVGQRPLSALS
jgi:2-polyprenyl-3-methyl-5-hydroxy-6-metoxy-1,4-benzoquinol methylase